MPRPDFKSRRIATDIATLSALIAPGGARPLLRFGVNRQLAGLRNAGPTRGMGSNRRVFELRRGRGPKPTPILNARAETNLHSGVSLALSIQRQELLRDVGNGSPPVTIRLALTSLHSVCSGPLYNASILSKDTRRTRLACGTAFGNG